MQNTRLSYMDVAKGIGILCMIAGHMRIAPINEFVYTWHMPLFVFISGYFFRPLPVARLLKKETQNLLYPYLFTCLLTVLAIAAVSALSGAGAGAVLGRVKDQALTSVFGAGGYNDRLLRIPYTFANVGVVWYLLALFIGLFLFNLLIRSAYAPLLIPMVAYLGYYLQTKVSLPWFALSGMTFTFFLYAGYREKAFLQQKPSVPLVLAFAACWYLCYRAPGFLELSGNRFPNGVLDVLGALAGIHLVIWLSRLVEAYAPAAITKPLIFFGRYSLVVMCAHSIEKMAVPWDSLLALVGIANTPVGYAVLFALKVGFAALAVVVTRHSPRLSKLYRIAA